MNMHGGGIIKKDNEKSIIFSPCIIYASKKMIRKCGKGALRKFNDNLKAEIGVLGKGKKPHV